MRQKTYAACLNAAVVTHKYIDKANERLKANHIRFNIGIVDDTFCTLIYRHFSL